MHHSARTALAAIITLLTTLTIHAIGASAQEDDGKRALISAMQPKTGIIKIANDIVELNIGPHFKYLDNADATTMLTKIIGNPPAAVKGNLGMILPAADGETWFAVLSYSADGHVPDSDATSINYDDLLKQMKEEASRTAKERRDEGFSGAEFLGWAQKPYYDSISKKLYWAKSIQFDNQPNPTLNYNVRILGRAGYLNINIVDSMDQLPKINTEMPEILSMANFTPTNKYSDYVASTDHTAAYGIAGLVAGGILAKAGFFKGLLVLAAAFWKVIAVTVVAFFAAIGNFFRKLFKRAPTQLISRSGLSIRSICFGRFFHPSFTALCAYALIERSFISY